jgi:hypothetical protein
MNAGFSNLDTLRKQLLPGTLANERRFDQVFTALGLGTAAAFENFCNRKFNRVADDTEILPADKCQFLLSRYPVETLTAIDLKTTEADGFVAQTVNTFVRTVDLKSGIVNCPEGADAGPWYAQVRFTYTGGFWWETLEPDDASYPSPQPAGSTALKEDLRLAWLMQCEAIWAQRDKLGIGLTDAPATQSKVAALDLSPLVKQMLAQFVRYNLV